MPDHRHAQLIAWLEDQGHSPAEVERVLAKVAEYDRRTVHDSVFDAIESGAFDLQTIVREALEESADGSAEG